LVGALVGADTGTRTGAGTTGTGARTGTATGASVGTSTDVGTGTCSIFLLVQFPIRNNRLKKPHLKGQKRLNPNNPQGGTVSFW
jgi:hypothetical protein